MLMIGMVVLKGVFEDSVCNALPFTEGHFQKRTATYGVWNTDTQTGM